jgi:hypothetical protein
LEGIEMVGSAVAKGLTALIALTFVGLFVYFWSDVLLDIRDFKPTAQSPRLVLTDGQKTILSVLSTAVATGTAAVLGITIVQERQVQLRVLAEGGTPSKGKVAWETFKQVFTTAAVLWIGILAYLIIGVLVVVAWYNESAVAPEVVATFGASVLGWGAGAIAAVFKASST